MITVTSITPTSENNCGLVEATVIGTSFLTDNVQAVQLIDSSGVIIIHGIKLTVVSETLLYIDFEINGKVPGIYHVKVIGTALFGLLANGFTITQSNNYCTFADVKRLCAIERLNRNNDTKIKSMIPRVCEIVDNETKRVWNVRTFTEIADHNTKNVVEDTFFTKYFPIVSVTSMVVNTIPLTENTDFVVYDSYIISLNGDYVLDSKGLVITYTGGNATVPEFIRQIATEVTAIFCNLKTVTYTTAEGIDKAVILTTVPEYVQDMYDKYRKRELW